MDNPWTLKGENVLISAPTKNGEKQGGMAINEGPITLKRKRENFPDFSASATWSDDYAFTDAYPALETANLLNPDSWFL